MILESILPGIQQMMLVAAKNRNDIELTAKVKDAISALSEERAWKACSPLFPAWMSNAERLVEMILQLNAEWSEVGFGANSSDSFEHMVSAHYRHFESETIYGATAKCILFAEYFLAMTRLELKWAANIRWTDPVQANVRYPRRSDD